MTLAGDRLTGSALLRPRGEQAEHRSSEVLDGGGGPGCRRTFPPLGHGRAFLCATCVPQTAMWASRRGRPLGVSAVTRKHEASSASSSAAMRRRVLPAMSRGRTDASIALAWPVVMSRFACPGRSSASKACSRSTVWTRRRVRASRRSVSIRRASSSPSSWSTRSVVVRTATAATACASWASVLRLWPVSKSRTRAASLAGTSTTCSPSSRSRCASGRPAPLLPSTAHTRFGQLFA